MNYDDWMKELDSEDRAHKDYRDRAQKVVDRYEAEEARSDRDNRESQYNILYSNVEVLHSALYNKAPVPDIRRRYLDKDPNGKDAAELAERAVSYSIDTYDYDGTMDTSLDDNLIAGMGVVRVRYQPYYENKPGDPVYLEERETGLDLDYNMQTAMFNGETQVDDYQADDNGFAYVDGEPEEKVVYEECTTEPVNWKRFRWQPSARWEDVDWCCIEHYMTKDELEDNYGKEKAKQIPMNYTEKGVKATPEETDDKGRALIYEIFDKKERKNIEFADGHDEILKEVEDPLGLEGYYPFPKPLFTTTKNGKLIPIPDYLFYQDQAIELDRVTQRINVLTEQLKYRGVYDGSFEELRNVENAEDGEFIAVADMSAIVGNGGQADLRKVIASMPLEDIQKAIMNLYKSREETKQVIYEITGIADIMRGSTAASETLGAQQLKTQFGSMRMQKRQRQVAHFNRDIIRLKTEVMVENFDPATLSMMTGMEFSQEVYDILTDDMMRSYRIDIETDSTITEDAAVEKQGRIELVAAVTDFFEKTAPLVAQGMMPPNLQNELLGFAVRGFKVGRTLEDTLDEMADNEGDPKMKQMQEQAQQQVEGLKQQAMEHIEGMKQEHGKEVQGLQKQLFDMQKKNAINGAVNEAKMFETATKAEIEKTTKEYGAQLSAMLEMFKVQMQSQQEVPVERMDALGDALNQIAQIIDDIDKDNQGKFDAIQGEMGTNKEEVANLLEFVKKPAQVIRDKTGKVVGAERK